MWSFYPESCTNWGKNRTPGMFIKFSNAKYDQIHKVLIKYVLILRIQNLSEKNLENYYFFCILPHNFKIDTLAGKGSFYLSLSGCISCAWYLTICALQLYWSTMQQVKGNLNVTIVLIIKKGVTKKWTRKNHGYRWVTFHRIWIFLHFVDRSANNTRYCYIWVKG